MITKDELKELVELKREGPTLDYKQDLNLGTEPDKAEFIKDVLALANTGRTAYIVTGIKDGTWKPVGISKSWSQVQLNQILQNRTDPPISTEYEEMELNGHIHGIVKIYGEAPPYLVMVKDKFGSIQRGIVFIRNNDMNEGARRADIDRMYARLQADLYLGHEISTKATDDLTEVEIKFWLLNRSEEPAKDTNVRVWFRNIEQLVRCTGNWVDITYLNENVPTIRLDLEKAVYFNIRLYCNGAIVNVAKDTEKIETDVEIWAHRMHKKGPYGILIASNEGI